MMIEITAAFVAQNQWYESGWNVFFARMCDNPETDHYEKWVCDFQSVEDFPELFTGITTGSTGTCTSTNFPEIVLYNNDFVER